MSGTAILFLGFTALTAAVPCAVVARCVSARAALGLATGLAIWLAYVGTLSGFGVIADTTLRPPGIAYVAAPVFLFVVFVVVRSATGRLALSIPVSLLIGLQTFRVGVELFLHQLWHEGLVPKTMTFEGANVDIWIGVSAPLVAWVANRGTGGKRLAIAWNVSGLLALANVVVRSALTAPGTSNLLHAEVANRAIGTFPYTFIAGFLAPLAAVLHVLALRALARRRVPSTIASSHSTERSSA